MIAGSDGLGADPIYYHIYYEGYFRSLQPLSEPLVGGMPIRVETCKINGPNFIFCLGGWWWVDKKQTYKEATCRLRQTEFTNVIRCGILVA